MTEAWLQTQHDDVNSATHRNAAILDARRGKQCVITVVGPTIWANKSLPEWFCEVGVSARCLQHTSQQHVEWKSGAEENVIQKGITSVNTERDPY